MVYGIQKGGWRGVVHCAIVVQWHCTSVGNADGKGQEKEDSLVHKSLELSEYRVKAKYRRRICCRRHVFHSPSLALAIADSARMPSISVYLRGGGGARPV